MPAWCSLPTTLRTHSTLPGTPPPSGGPEGAQSWQPSSVPVWAPCVQEAGTQPSLCRRKGQPGTFHVQTYDSWGARGAHPGLSGLLASVLRGAPQLCMLDSHLTSLSLLSRVLGPKYSHLPPPPRNVATAWCQLGPHSLLN